jgi:hypothetical protein
MFKKGKYLVLAAAISLAANPLVAQETNAVSASGPAENEKSTLGSWRDASRWSLQFGVGFITESTVDKVALVDARLGDHEDGGELYLFQASYKLAHLDPTLFGHRVKLDLELPLVLGVVNENHNDPFMQYSGGLTLRWKTFPWNHWVYTTIESGVGLTYSQQVLQIERTRHPNRDRSHLEFYWPIQLTLAHPRHRQHQLVLFLHHHSGGTIFHTGGANSLGAGYRYVFDERRSAP